MADDEPHIRRILTTLLEAASFQVDVVSDGAAALTRLLSRRPYDLVLLDIVMPRASGLEVLERVRDVKHRRKVPIVILTAKEMSSQDRDRLRGKMEALIQKTETPLSDLPGVVGHLLRRQHKEGASV